MVPFCIHSVPVGTMAMPADPWWLVGSRYSWKAVLKSALVVVQPPSTKMLEAAGSGWVSSGSFGLAEASGAGCA